MVYTKLLQSYKCLIVYSYFKIIELPLKYMLSEELQNKPK